MMDLFLSSLYAFICFSYCLARAFSFNGNQTMIVSTHVLFLISNGMLVTFHH